MGKLGHCKIVIDVVENYYVFFFTVWIFYIKYVDQSKVMQCFKKSKKKICEDIKPNCVSTLIKRQLKSVLQMLNKFLHEWRAYILVVVLFNKCV